MSTPRDNMNPSSSDPATGVILLGGAHGALAIARSLGRKNIPVVLVTNDHPLPKLSRYVRRSYEWPKPIGAQSLKWLTDLALRENLQNWLVIPCGDNEAQIVARHLDDLRSTFRIQSCPWDRLKLLCDKQLLAEFAASLGVATPRSYQIKSTHDAADTEVLFPVVLKPGMRLARNAFTLAKAWRADTRDELIERYTEAARLVGADNVVVQEMVPGTGATQFSYAALWQDGKPVAELTARRARQYPVDFSYTSTFVEIVGNDEVVKAARALLTAISFGGLVEVEFKFDERDRQYKVLDVNPRAWSWLALCESAGIDLATMMVRGTASAPSEVTSTAQGHAWVNMLRDVVSSTQLIARGDITLTGYLRSLRQKLTFATFAWDDPLPGLLELPLTVYRTLTTRLPSIMKNMVRLGPAVTR